MTSFLFVCRMFCKTRGVSSPCSSPTSPSWCRILLMPIATSSWLEPPTSPSARSWCCWPRSRQSRMSRPPSGRFRSDETTTSSKRRKSAVRTLQGRPVRRAAKPLRPDRVVRTLQPTLLPRRLTNGRRSSRCRRRSANNILLACAAHNAYMAEMDYGKQKMDQYRRSADRVREPEPSFQLCPDTVHQSSSSAA